jgi:uncharacterized ferritin-like protein (DUF455 family)
MMADLALPLASLSDGAVAILATADPMAKASASRRLAEIWDAGGLEVGDSVPPPRPARPERPQLRSPKDMPKQRAFGSLAGRIALLHALAHIELNATDLAWDIIARFSGESRPRSFFDDWVGVAAQEAVHFELHSGSPISEPAMATCRPMTGCGNRLPRQPMICSPASPSCRSCSRRAGST